MRQGALSKPAVQWWLSLNSSTRFALCSASASPLTSATMRTIYRRSRASSAFVSNTILPLGQR